MAWDVRGQLKEFSIWSRKKMPKKTSAPAKEENIQLGPQAREGENVFGVAHIFASFNDTFVVCLLTYNSM